MSAKSTDPDVTIDLPADIQFIPLVRHMLRQAFPPLGTGDDGVYFGAVTEILANAVASHHDRLHLPISIDVDVHDDPRITVSDQGSGFDVERTGSGPFAEGRGNGLRLARSACPNLTIHSSSAGTIVELPFTPSHGS